MIYRKGDRPFRPRNTARARAIRSIAAQHLRETGNHAVAYGDCGLLDEIALRADPAMIELHPLRRHKVVLDALRTARDLVPGFIRYVHLARCYWLPEHAPQREHAAK